MAKQPLYRKRLKSERVKKIKKFGSNRLDLLMTAAMALPGLGIASVANAQQSATEFTSISLGYLDYQDHQKGGRGVGVQSPTLYFKSPLGPRTEIQGGILYDSISGASTFSLKALNNSGPSVPTPAPVAPAVNPPTVPTGCKMLPIQALSRASGGSVAPVVQPAPRPPAPRPPASNGGNSSGGSNNAPVCPVGTVPITTVIPNTVSPAVIVPPSNNYESDDEGDEEDGNHEGQREDRVRYQATPKSEFLSDKSSYGYFSDKRYAGDVKVTHYLDSFSLGVGAAYSTENDYDSITVLADTKIWTPDKNTTFVLGISGNFDTVGSSADPSLSASKHSQSYILGVTQVLSPIAIMQSNVTANTQQGYLSDPYLPADNRPDSRQSLAWLTRYNLFIEPLDAAMHLDYRLYGDVWGVLSHMVEMSWYQPISESLMLRPSIRYYTQSAVDFYTYDGTPEPNQANYTVDQRLSSFGGLTLGLKAIADLGAGFSGSVGYNYLMQNSDLQLTKGKSSTVRDALTGQYILFELTKRF